ncbi:MAG: enoyl-CoA hydratase/isomerase family protein [Microthrixaceae bacterium]
MVTSKASDTIEFDTITFEVTAHVATITLDRPDRMNAFDHTMCEEMQSAWATVRDTDDIHVAVLQANGERAFCTGLDVKQGAWWRDDNIWNHVDPGVYLGPRSNQVWKPVVCAVQGMCAGGGQYMVNESDIVIASEDATFFDPHANGSIVSAVEPIGMLHRGVPLGEVLRWALMGSDERLTAQTAQRIGLVTEVVPADELRSRAADIAAQIAGRDPIAIQGTVRAIWEATEMPPSVAKQNGLLYTHIGNRPPDERTVQPPSDEPPFLR